MRGITASFLIQHRGRRGLRHGVIFQALFHVNEDILQPSLIDDVSLSKIRHFAYRTRWVLVHVNGNPRRCRSGEPDCS